MKSNEKFVFYLLKAVFAFLYVVIIIVANLIGSVNIKDIDNIVVVCCYVTSDGNSKVDFSFHSSDSNTPSNRAELRKPVKKFKDKKAKINKGCK